MTRRQGVFTWENEPSGGRRSEFASTTASGWQHSTQSTFAEPSRHEYRVARRRARERARQEAIKRIAVLVLLALAVGAMAVWSMAGRLLDR